MTRHELMISACVTVEQPIDEAELVRCVENVLREFGHHVAVDIPDMRDRSLLRDRRGRFRSVSV